jgi:NAD(P)-dependent dehydrogenase (short-subunit alcohol dehydrogenase family)
MGLTTYAGTTAVVTGAAHGIGRALAARLVGAGARVVLSDIRAEAVHEAAAGLGPAALAVECDVSSRASVAELGEVVRGWAPAGVDLLCLNAGVFTPRHALTATHEDWQWVLGVCLGGVVHGVEEFLPGMVAAGRDAHLLVTASMNGYLPSRHSPLYSTAKYAVVGLAETLRLELATTRVGVTLLNPSAVETRIAHAEEVRQERFARDRADAPDAAFADYGLSTALQPDEVAALALDGVVAGREVVFTDPVVRPLLEAQHARLMSSFDL